MCWKKALACAAVLAFGFGCLWGMGQLTLFLYDPPLRQTANQLTGTEARPFPYRHAIVRQHGEVETAPLNQPPRPTDLRIVRQQLSVHTAAVRHQGRRPSSLELRLDNKSPYSIEVVEIEIVFLDRLDSVVHQSALPVRRVKGNSSTIVPLRFCPDKLRFRCRVLNIYLPDRSPQPRVV